mgnify:CR=1 FL=1
MRPAILAAILLPALALTGCHPRYGLRRLAVVSISDYAAELPGEGRSNLGRLFTEKVHAHLVARGGFDSVRLNAQEWAERRKSLPAVETPAPDAGLYVPKELRPSEPAGSRDQDNASRRRLETLILAAEKDAGTEGIVLIDVRGLRLEEAIVQDKPEGDPDRYRGLSVGLDAVMRMLDARSGQTLETDSWAVAETCFYGYSAAEKDLARQRRSQEARRKAFANCLDRFTAEAVSKTRSYAHHAP